MLRTQKIVVSPGWGSSIHANGFADVDAVYRSKDGDGITKSPTTEVRRVVLKHEQGQCTVFIKKYWANNFKQMWKGALRGTFIGISKAQREFENLLRLRQWGLDAPAPVAYGEERHARWLKRSFLISESVPQPLPLDIFIRDILPQKPTHERHQLRREMIEKLASYTLRLHGHRFVHHDYYWRNIILTGQSLEHFYLIDAHKGRCWPAWAEARSRAKDLATLDAPAHRFFRRTERLRFFLHYMEHKTLTDADKVFIRRIMEIAAPLRTRELKRVAENRSSGAK